MIRARRRISAALGLIAVGLASAVLLGAGASGPKPRPVPYPEGYRSWTHVKSMAILGPEHPLFASFGGIHHVYANDKALIALRSGKPHAEGSILVFDLLEAEQSGGAATEGRRKFTAVMVKSRDYADTGKWGFEAFAENSKTQRVVKDAASECFACHASQEDGGFVFTRWRP